VRLRSAGLEQGAGNVGGVRVVYYTQLAKGRVRLLLIQAISVVAQLKTKTGVGYGPAGPSAPRSAPWSLHGTYVRRVSTARTRPLRTAEG